MNEYLKRRARIKTGDIILFSGKSGVSRTIKLLTASDWSHVGMAVRLSLYGSDSLFLWESTELVNIADLETQHAKPGAQLVPMAERIRKYRGAVAIRHLSPAITPDMGRRLGRLRRRFRATPYERNRLEIFKAAYDGPFGKNQEDLSSLFCSELVAAAYQAMSLLPTKANEATDDTPYQSTNEYSPRDFSAAGNLHLLNAFRLGKELPLKLDNP